MKFVDLCAIITGLEAKVGPRVIAQAMRVAKLTAKATVPITLADEDPLDPNDRPFKAF